MAKRPAPANRKGNPGILYIIGHQIFETASGDYVKAYKVGVATVLAERLREHQTGSAMKLRALLDIYVDNALLVEKTVKAMFADKICREDGEWYMLSEEDIKVVAAFGESRRLEV